ncbi:MAG: fumarylacetoacetate hydrolase family protein [Syntrophomonadaceae bacterium]|nr:fumarylacetoacetate hydrolase family protein [Syntrophomonadaceae bacterium]
MVNDTVRYGIVEEDMIYPIQGDLFGELVRTGEKLKLSEVILLSPCQPSKVVCVGLNYADHAEELNLNIPKEPLLFLKPPSAVIGPGDFIIYPNACQQLDYEGELAVVIREKAKNISVQEVHKVILGYTCGNDITARDLQRLDGQWTRAKSFDTFCPLGPWINNELDPTKINIKLWVNDELKQNSNTSRMIFPVDFLVSYISRIMTLYPGDVILTGTPFGVGSLKSGDRITVEIEGLGRLPNQVKTEGF